MFYNLRVGSFNLKYSPLKPIEQEFPYCDKDGNLLKRIAKVKGEYAFIDDKGTEHKTAFKLINGKATAKLSKTKETDRYKEVDRKESEDLIVEGEYFVDCDRLLNELKESGKSLKFGFTFGNGYKVYKAYIYVDELYNNLFMRVGTTQKSELLQEIIAETKQKQKAESISLTIQGIERAKVEDLIEL